MVVEANGRNKNGSLQPADIINYTPPKIINKYECVRR